MPHRLGLMLFLILTACEGGAEITGEYRITALGDSALDFNEDESTPQQLAHVLTERGVENTVQNNAISGATAACGENGIGDEANCIPPQIEEGDWTHILLSGGGNDILDSGCNISADEMVSEDLSSGHMVDIINRVTEPGHKVILYGYFRANDNGGEMSSCQPLYTLLDRYEALGETRNGIVYIDAADAVTARHPRILRRRDSPFPRRQQGHRRVDRGSAPRLGKLNTDSFKDDLKNERLGNQMTSTVRLIAVACVALGALAAIFRTGLPFHRRERHPGRRPRSRGTTGSRWHGAQPGFNSARGWGPEALVPEHPAGPFLFHDRGAGGATPGHGHSRFGAETMAPGWGRDSLHGRRRFLALAEQRATHLTPGVAIHMALPQLAFCFSVCAPTSSFCARRRLRG